MGAEDKNILSNFEQKVLKGLNKTEAEKRSEQVTDFREIAIIQCQSSIARLSTLELATVSLEIQKATTKLKHAEKSVEQAKYSLPADNEFETYIENLNQAMKNVSEIKSTISKKELEKLAIETQLKYYQELLEIFE